MYELEHARARVQRIIVLALARNHCVGGLGDQVPHTRPASAGPKVPNFADQYARASRIGWYARADAILDESRRAEGMDMAGVSAIKLYTDNLKWCLARMLPSDFGDRLQVSGNTGGGSVVNVYLPAKGAPGDGARVTIDGQAVEVEE
jgi:hypothetical protein